MPVCFAVEVGEVWERIMEDPTEALPELLATLAPDSLEEVVPEDMQQVRTSLFPHCGQPTS